jgi:hypothetical protein
MAMRPDTELPAWSLSADTVLQELAVDSARGLEEDEALRRRRVFGRNQLQVAQQRHLRHSDVAACLDVTNYKLRSSAT